MTDQVLNNVQTKNRNSTATMESVRRAACALSLLLHLISAAPSLVTPPPITRTSCLPTSLPASSFPPDHVCKRLFSGTTRITVPNPLSAGMGGTPEEWFKQALLAFDPFNAAFLNAALLNENQFCSDKIYTLLCFFYFPICAEDDRFPGGVSVFPCKDVCTEITREDSNCTRQLKQAQEKHGKEFEKEENRGWSHFKHCNYTYKSDSSTTVAVFNSSICVNNRHQTTLPTNVKPIVTKEVACAVIGKLYITSNSKFTFIYDIVYYSLFNRSRTFIRLRM